MLKSLICALIILTVASTLEIEQLYRSKLITIEDRVNSVNRIGDLGLNDYELREIPAFLSQGMNGTGYWLNGIVDKEEDIVDYIKRRTEAPQEYAKGLMYRNPDTKLKFAGMVRRHGYPVEEYEVETDDGYLLTVFRIPCGVHSPPVAGVTKPVVFLMHGFMDSSDGWIILGPRKSLGYILADAGYDVWFGNQRGNTYSRKHVNKKVSDVSFWEFSWDEIGRFDLTAMIDFALEDTGEKKLYYVGHSHGTTSFFAMAAMRPEYNDKIRIMYALSPMAFMSNMVSPLIKLNAPLSREFEWIKHNMGVGEFKPSIQLLTVAGGVICKDRAITQDICRNTNFIVCGFDSEKTNITKLPVIMSHVPSGSSIRQFLHYGQSVSSKDFRRFDFGTDKNIKKYGRSIPPKYNLPNIKLPVALYYSENDWLSHPKDVAKLSRKLRNVVDFYPIPPKFSHMDYMWAADVDKIIHERILKTMIYF